MPAGFPAGAVFVDVVPSFTGFPGALSRGLVRPAESAGADAGDAAGSGLSGGVLGKLKGLAGPLAAGFAALGIGAIITDAIASGMENEKITDRLAASLGATGPKAEQLGRVAGDLYANAYGDSMEEVADSLRGIIGSGLVDPNASDADLSKLSSKVLDLSSTFGTEAGEISRAATQLLRNGLAENADQALDVITKGFTSAANGGGDLLDVLGEYGSTFSSFGIDGAESVGILNQALAAGIPNADFAADSIRELGIIVTEGSDDSVKALTALGLNAGAIQKDFAAGGDAASGALDKVFDSLRNVQDPVERSTLATTLLGSQYEDLGDALLAIDPSEAAKGLGEVSGAAEQLGNTLNDNASTNIESFKRRVSTLATNVIGAELIPFVDKAASFLGTVLGPAITEVGGGIEAFFGAFAAGDGDVTSSGIPGVFERIGNATRTIVDNAIAAGKAIGSFIDDHSTAITTFAAAVGGAAAAFGAVYAVQQAIAGVRFGVFLVQYAAQVGVVNLATKAWAATQAVLNGVMAINPVTLIVLAIGALIGILAVLFVKNQGFHDFVVGLWGGIRSAIGGAVEFVTGTVFPAFSAAVDAVGSFLRGLYDDVVRPTFTVIAMAVEFYIGLVVGYVKLWIAIVEAVGIGIKFLYDNVVRPVFGFIGDVIRAVWQDIVLPVFTAIVDWVGSKLTLAFTVYRDLVLLVWGAVRDGIVSAWTWIRDKVFAPVVEFLGTNLSRAFTVYRDLAVGAWEAVRAGVNTAYVWFRDNVFSPVVTWLSTTLSNAFTGFQIIASAVWSGIKTVISDVYVWIRDNVFSPLGTWITVTVPGYFRSGVEAIGKAWDGLKEAAKAPVRFVVDTVINDGIVDRFNTIADVFGAKHLNRLALPDGFATGGAIRGPGTGTSDSIPAWLSNGEYVIRADSVRRYGLGFLDDVNAGRLPGFATGGIVDLGKWFENLGARVTEHPAFGGVHPVHKGRGHYDGRAIDVNYGPGGQNATESAFFDRYAQQVRDMGFKVLWRAPGHFDHLHAEAPSTGFLGKITDALGSAASSITGPFTAILDKLGDSILSTPFGSMVAGGAKNLVNSVVDWVKDKSAGLLHFGGSDDVVGEYDGATGRLAPNDARAAARSMLPGGWSFADLDKLWTKESGWRWNADNPGSSAYGIPQALPGSKMKSAGADWLTNAVTQIRWGLGYIDDRYGNSSKAWAHSVANNWYASGGLVGSGRPALSFDSGGYLPPGYSTVYNGTRAPEPVFTREQAAAIAGARGGEDPTFGSLFRDVYPREEVDVDVLARRMTFAMASTGGLGG